MFHRPHDPQAMPQDFLRHLQERLGVGETAAASTLADWISTYQPGPTALTCGLKASRHRRRAA
jgi:hypothetical protein